jgi:hypothetical protein
MNKHDERSNISLSFFPSHLCTDIFDILDILDIATTILHG